jgi:hypothetical protein
LNDGYIAVMTTIREIRQAIEKLPTEKLAEFRAWYWAFDAAQWDKQFDGDVRSGRLNALADQALVDLAEKRCKPL